MLLEILSEYLKKRRRTVLMNPHINVLGKQNPTDGKLTARKSLIAQAKAKGIASSHRPCAFRMSSTTSRAAPLPPRLLVT